MSAKKAAKQNISERAPVIAVMGHIDHGKSTLLDYIRKTKIVESEAGGITQHISAYEVVHTAKDGSEKKITFLDTPGHEAFQKMRTRGGEAADIAILMVSAEDGVKPQTLEALAAIKESNTPYIVAINKIDTPKADIEQTKANLLENEIYLEGLGGDVPFVPISAKSGEGVPELLDMMLLVAELQELTGDTSATASGIVIESHRDPKRGVSATLIIRNGTMKSGSFVVAGGASAPLRMIEDFNGKTLKEASFSSPVTVIGFNEVPEVGSNFTVVSSKKEAEQIMLAGGPTSNATTVIGNEKKAHILIPVILKADVRGSIEAIEHELHKLENDRIALKIVSASVGAVSEGDVKTASGSDHAVIVGFHVGVDSAARDLADRLDIHIGTFDIIYELAEWLQDEIKKRTPKMTVSERTGLSKVKRIFSQTKDKQVLGGKVTEGTIAMKSTVAILRRGEKIGEGVVTSLQQAKSSTETVEEGNEFGAQIESKIEIVGGDELEGFVLVEK